MNITIKKVGNLYQVADNETPIDATTLREMIKSLSQKSDADVSKVMDNIDNQGETSLDVGNEKGVIVDLYEVPYTKPADPEKETQELARHLNEKKDFVTQYLFPGSTTNEVIVGLRQDIIPDAQKEKQIQASHKIAYAKDLDSDSKDFIQKTGKMPEDMMKNNLSMTNNNWLMFMPPIEYGFSRVCIGADRDSFIIAGQSLDDLELYNAPYKELVESNVNPLDLLQVLSFVTKKGPNTVEEHTKLSSFMAKQGEEIIPILVSRKKQNG